MTAGVNMEIRQELDFCCIFGLVVWHVCLIPTGSGLFS